MKQRGWGRFIYGFLVVFLRGLPSIIGVAGTVRSYSAKPRSQAKDSETTSQRQNWVSGGAGVPTKVAT